MSNSDIASLFLLDFTRMVDNIERARSSEIRRFVGTYPPVNIIRKNDNWLIQLALAGYAEKDVEVVVDNNQLIVRTTKQVDENLPDGIQYLHRGISQRAFDRRWQLEQDMEITGASFENGMLSIGVTRIVPEDKKPKTIAIGGKNTAELHQRFLE